MKNLWIGIAAVIAVAGIGPASAQVPWPGASQPQSPPATYPDPARYRFNATTPDDAYRQGLINRWELEQLQGPTPQALQGPSPDSSKSEPGR